MHTQRPNVRSGFARDPKDGEVSIIVEFEEAAFVDCADSELPFDGGDEGGPLEEGSGQCLDDLLR
jgi:hypothetical protein